MRHPRQVEVRPQQVFQGDQQLRLHRVEPLRLKLDRHQQADKKRRGLQAYVPEPPRRVLGLVK
eukprot:4846375-Amphidinium_carterae.1